MSPVPKRKHSYGRKKRKYHHKRTKAPAVVKCPHCKTAKRAHRTCPECGKL